VSKWEDVGSNRKSTGFNPAAMTMATVWSPADVGSVNVSLRGLLFYGIR
jgi:hypothetical protein